MFEAGGTFGQLEHQGSLGICSYSLTKATVYQSHVNDAHKQKRLHWVKKNININNCVMQPWMAYKDSEVWTTTKFLQGVSEEKVMFYCFIYLFFFIFLEKNMWTAPKFWFSMCHRQKMKCIICLWSNSLVLAPSHLAILHFAFQGVTEFD